MKRNQIKWRRTEMEKKEFNKEIYIYICLFTMRVLLFIPIVSCILYLEIRRFYLQYTVLDAVRIIRYIMLLPFTQSYSVLPPRFVIIYT